MNKNKSQDFVDYLLNIEFWYAHATRFDLGICPIYKRLVLIESVQGGWVLRMERINGWFLGKDAQWYWEKSEKRLTHHKEFKDNITFESPQQVYDFWKVNIKELQPLYII